jgi:membrane protein YdbS with pleckstrin-like domain
MNQRDSFDAEVGSAQPGQPTGSTESLEGGAGMAPQPAAPEAAKPDTTVEADLWIGRTHWKHFAGLLTLWLLGNLVVCALVIWAAPRWEWLTFRGGLTLIVAVLAISGLEFVGRRVLLKVFDHRYRLTTQRLFIERGLLSQTIDQTELIRVDDVRIHKTLLGRILGVGSVAIVSTDATDREITIEGIAHADEVAEAIRDRMRAMRRKSLFIENL